MRAPRFPRSARAVRSLAVAGLGAGLLVATPAAQGHGGTTVAEGGKDGVTIVVQGVASQTGSGGPAVDLSTIVGGPGSGKGASVDYWVRPAEGKKAFKVETTRDEGGTFHADVSTANRGTWSDWAVSAIVNLNNDKRLRVANVSGDAIPGPAPTRPAAEQPADEGSGGSGEGPTTPTLSEGPSTPAEAPASGETTADDGGVAIDDVSGEDNGPPGWAFPSLLVLTVIGLAILAVKRRRPRQD